MISGLHFRLCRHRVVIFASCIAQHQQLFLPSIPHVGLFDVCRADVVACGSDADFDKDLLEADEGRVLSRQSIVLGGETCEMIQ